LPQAQHKATSPTRKTLPASLKDETAKMNDRNKHKITGQMNHQTADPKANASVFLFLPKAHFLKTIFAQSTNGTFAKPHKPTHSPSFAKEPFFANALQNHLNTINKM
jgi:hypothetical protein